MWRAARLQPRATFYGNWKNVGACGLVSSLTEVEEMAFAAKQQKKETEVKHRRFEVTRGSKCIRMKPLDIPIY